MPNESAAPRAAAQADSPRRVPVRFAAFVGAPLDGAPSRLRGSGHLELAGHGLVLHHRIPMAEVPEWAVGMIVGGCVVYYLLLAYVAPQLLPAAWRDPGPIVPAMTAALATWAAVRAFGPSRPAQLRLGRKDVQAVLVDPTRRRTLIQTGAGQLVGIALGAAPEPLRAHCERHWPGTLHEGPVGRRWVGRRTFVTLALMLAVALALLFAPN